MKVGTQIVIRSLSFKTNRTEYGPYGTVTGQPFSHRMEGGVIVGFHGRAGDNQVNGAQMSFPAGHLEKPFSRASLIHGCQHLSSASGTISQVLFLVLCSGHDSSSSLTNKANIAALHEPSG
ncbi:agglutinin [Quercus suber]|uniref:Agglutinin n=1 Tax=Quercus suber TaxID=58331 RepID=A0AAW0KYF7_QUESU